FQAEDGIRDKLVTGVQTCALPISPSTYGNYISRKHRQWDLFHNCLNFRKEMHTAIRKNGRFAHQCLLSLPTAGQISIARIRCDRSEERRVGKECRCRRARKE